MSQDRTLCIWPFWCLLLWQKSFYKTQQVCVLRTLDVWGSLQLSWRSQWCPTFPPLRHALMEFLLDVNPDSSLLPVLCILPLTSVSFFFSLSFLFFLFLLSFHVVSRVGVPLSSLSEDCASLIQFFFYMFYFSKYFLTVLNLVEQTDKSLSFCPLLQWANNIDSYLKVSLRLRVLPEAGMWLQL